MGIFDVVDGKRQALRQGVETLRVMMENDLGWLEEFSKWDDLNVYQRDFIEKRKGFIRNILQMILDTQQVIGKSK